MKIGFKQVGMAVALTCSTVAQANDFSSFNLGSIDQQQGWTTRDGFVDCQTVNTTWNQSIMDVDGVRVWQLSNAVTSSTYSSQPFSPTIAGQVAGETDAALWNDRGTNGCSPQPTAFGAYADASTFYHSFTFRSATGAPQPGLNVTLSASAKQSAVRMTWLQLVDNGTTGIDVRVIEAIPAAGNPTVQVAFTAPTTIATLNYIDTHTVSFTIDFVDGVTDNAGVLSGNDVVKVYVNGSLAHTGTTWELYYYFNERIVAGTPRRQAVNAVLYRLAGTAAPATAGNGFHFLSSTTANSDPQPPLPTIAATGFFSPVDMEPLVNAARAGRTVPLKFRLTDDNGDGINVPGLIFEGEIVQTTHSAGPADEIDQYVAGASGLQYLGDGYYQWNLQTSNSWQNQTRRLTVRLSAPGYELDTELTALFRFR